MDQQQQHVTPSLTFLDMSGDVTISWTPDSEDAILSLVEAKMKQGYSFFILEPRKLGFIPLPAKKVPVTSIAQARVAGRVSMPEEDVNRGVNRMLANAKVDDPEVGRLLASGQAQLAQVGEKQPLNTVSRATTPQQVVRHQTVGVRPIWGG
ncbi:hypothetical protein D3C71_25330 [compost metagenome]